MGNTNTNTVDPIYPDYSLFHILCHVAHRVTGMDIDTIKANLATHPVWQRLDAISNTWVAQTLARSMEQEADGDVLVDPLGTLQHWLDQGVSDKMLLLISKLPVQNLNLDWEQAVVKDAGQGLYVLRVPFQWDPDTESHSGVVKFSL